VTESPQQDGFGLDLILGALRRRLPIIVLAVVLAAAAAGAVGLREQPRYTSTAALLFRTSPVGAQAAAASGSADPARATKTNLDLASLGVIAQQASSRLHGRLTPAQVQAQISLGSDAESDVLKVTATDTTPSGAVGLANAYAAAAVDYRKQAAREQIRAAEQDIRAKLARLRSGRGGGLDTAQRAQGLQSSLSDLMKLEDVQTGDVQVAERAGSAAPAGPHLKLKLIAGGFAGLLLGIVVALLLEQLDRRVKRSDEVEDALQLPVLGSVPHSRALATRLTPTLPPYETEAFRLLDVNLRYLDSGRPVRSILLTSVAPREGKTTVALHLARSWVAVGYTVLLVDADLRKASLSRVFGLEGTRGLSDVLRDGGQDPSEALVDVTRAAQTNGSRPSGSLLCLPAGTPSSEPLELLGSSGLAAILRGAEERFDIVIVDASPVGTVADAIPVTRMVSGVIVVTRLGTVTRERLQEVTRQLESASASVLGVVVNSVDRTTARYFAAYATAQPDRSR
jgi:polysaccharide biosynthesis transport protein